jgi:hypothetical protein
MHLIVEQSVFLDTFRSLRAQIHHIGRQFSKYLSRWFNICKHARLPQKLPQMYVFLRDLSMDYSWFEIEHIHVPFPQTALRLTLRYFPAYQRSIVAPTCCKRQHHQPDYWVCSIHTHKYYGMYRVQQPDHGPNGASTTLSTDRRAVLVVRDDKPKS